MRRRSSQCLLPHESADRATTRSIRRPKPCSQSREAVRMRAAPQSPFSIASWCGLLHASRLMRPLLDPSYFHARLLSPKDNYLDYSIPFVSAEVPFHNENGQKWTPVYFHFLQRKPWRQKVRMCDATRKKRAVFTNPLKKTQVETKKSAFAPGTHA